MDSNNLNTPEEIYNTYSKRMLGICCRYFKNKWEAEDIMHDGFISVFTKLDSYKNKGSFEGWIKRIMINTALQKLRKGNFEELFENIPEDKTKNKENTFDFENIPSKNFYEILGQAEFDASEIIEFIHKLPNPYKTVFNLFVIDQFSHKQIAEQLNIRIGTSKSRLSRGREMLKEILYKEALHRIEEKEKRKRAVVIPLFFGKLDGFEKYIFNGIQDFEQKPVHDYEFFLKNKAKPGKNISAETVVKSGSLSIVKTAAYILIPLSVFSGIWLGTKKENTKHEISTIKPIQHDSITVLPEEDTSPVNTVSNKNSTFSLKDNVLKINSFVHSFDTRKFEVFYRPVDDTILINSKSGAKILIDPKNLELKSNNHIKIVFKDFTVKKDFLLNNLATVSNGDLLISDGMFYLNVRQDGENMKISEKKSVVVQFSSGSNSETGLFLGRKDSLGIMGWADMKHKIKSNKPDYIVQRVQNGGITNFVRIDTSVCTYSSLNKNDTLVKKEKDSTWYEYRIKHYYPQTNTRTLSTVPIDSITAVNFRQRRVTNRQKKQFRQSSNSTSKTTNTYFPIELQQFGWINCDRFYNKATPRTNFTLKLRSPDTIPTMLTYLIFTNISSMMTDVLTPQKNDFEGFRNLPVCENVKVLSIYTDGDKILCYENDTVITEDHVEPVWLKEVSREEFGEILENLDEENRLEKTTEMVRKETIKVIKKRSSLFYKK